MYRLSNMYILQVPCKEYRVAKYKKTVGPIS